MEKFQTLSFVLLLFCKLKSVLTLPVEPVCSKFAYEEQLLQKMVRMEFFVENMQKDVQKSITNAMNVMNAVKEKNVKIADNLSGLHEQIENVTDSIKKNNAELANTNSVLNEQIEKVELEVKNVTDVMKEIYTEVADNLSPLHGNIKKLELKNENVTDTMRRMAEKDTEVADIISVQNEQIEKVKLKTETITDTMKDTKEKVTEVADKLSELDEKIKKLELKNENIVEKIDHNGNAIEKMKASETPAVAFNAYKAVEYSGKDAVVFSTVILNEGEAYNKETGIFTAPTDGIYQFNAHLCFALNVDVEYCLNVGGRSIAMGEYRVPQGATDTKCTSFSAVALVRKHEQVRVGCMYFAKLINSVSDDWNSFSGVLIKTM